MKVLLTGSTGFIGKYLLKALVEGGHSIIAIKGLQNNTSFLEENNIHFCYYTGNYEAIYNFIQQEHPTGIIHLAARITEKHTENEITNLIATNVLFPTHLIEAAVNTGVKWFINTGTFWQHYNNNVYSPTNLYAASKQSFKDIAQYYYEATTINFATLELFDTFGTNDTRPKLMNLWLKNLQSKEVLEMSAGEQVIDISYIDNITDAFITLMNLMHNDTKREHCGKSFVLKSDERLTLKKLAALFESVTEKKLNIVWGKRPYRNREIMTPYEYGISIPGWKPKISLEEGIRIFYKNSI